jgi:hypothetical protein
VGESVKRQRRDGKFTENVTAEHEEKEPFGRTGVNWSIRFNLP